MDSRQFDAVAKAAAAGMKTEERMDGTRFDETAKRLAGTRRAALSSGAALAFGGMLSALSPQAADARRRRPKPTYTCPPPSETDLRSGFIGRIAQSFTASRGGTLRQIKVAIRKEVSGGDFVVQLVAMAGAVPSSSPADVLAAVTVPDAQVKSGDVTLVANFATTRLVQGTQYAVVARRTNDKYLVVYVHLGGDDCTGALFSASGGEAFEPLNGDMIVTVLVL